MQQTYLVYICSQVLEDHSPHVTAADVISDFKSLYDIYPSPFRRKFDAGRKVFGHITVCLSVIVWCRVWALKECFSHGWWCKHVVSKRHVHPSVPVKQREICEKYTLSCCLPKTVYVTAVVKTNDLNIPHFQSWNPL